MQRPIVDFTLTFVFVSVMKTENTHALADWELIPEPVIEFLDSTGSIITVLNMYLAYFTFNNMFNLFVFILAVYLPLIFLLVLLGLVQLVPRL